LSTTDNTFLSTTDNINHPLVVEEESLNNKILTSTSRKPGMSTTDNIKQDMLPPVDISPIDAPFGRISARWCKYFDDISAVEADLLGDFLDDKELVRLANEATETAEVWILAAIEETAIAKAKQPIKYLRKVLNNWIQRGYRIPPQKGQQDATPNGTHERPGNVESNVESILDQLERGDIEPGEARRQLAAYGHIL
jgi:hypothetical protein